MMKGFHFFAGVMTVLVALFLLFSGSVIAQPQYNFAKSFMLIVNKGLPPTDPNQRKIVDVSKPDVTLIVPSRLDAHGLSVDAEENLYVTYKTDLSMPDAIVVGENSSYSSGILGLPTVDLTNSGGSFSVGGKPLAIVGSSINTVIEYAGQDFNVIYEAKVGTIGLPSGQTLDVSTPAAFDWGKGAISCATGSAPMQNLMLINLAQKACFALVDCDPMASWHAWDGDTHSYGTHTGHIGEWASFMPGDDPAAPTGPKTSICYPHTYQSASNADDSGMDGGSTAGDSAGGLTEPYGQNVGAPDWTQPTAIPNGAWWHAKHSTTAGNGNYAEVRRRQYWPIFMDVLLEKYLRGDPPQQGDPPNYAITTLPAANAEDGQSIKFDQKGFNACEWKYPQCADSCYSQGGGNPSVTPTFTRNPYQIIVGPSGRVYKYAAYRPQGVSLIQYLEPDAQDWTDLDLTSLPGWVVDVDCEGNFEEKVNSIGCATKALDEDWLYLSSSPSFAVGDQFDGQGGICYIMKEENGVKSIIKKKYQGQNSLPVEPVDLGPGIDVNFVDAIAADGMGQLYFTTKNPTGNGNTWTISDPATFDQKTIDAFDPNINPGKFTASNVQMKRQASIDLHHVDLRTGTPQKDQAVGSGDIGSSGQVVCSRVLDPVNDPNVVNSQNIVDIIPDNAGGNFDMSSIHVALATVVGATPPINGRNGIDIVGPAPTGNVTHSTSQGIDVLTVEDLEDNGSNNLAWIAENWETNYNFSDPAAQAKIWGSPVDIQNTAIDTAAAIYSQGPWSTAQHKNAYHYNWYNNDDRAYGDANFSGDINGNGFAGGWSSNIVGDGANTGLPPGTNTTNGPWAASSPCPVHDTRAWRWAVYMTHTVEKTDSGQGQQPTYAMKKLEPPLLIYGYDLMGYMTNTPEDQSKVSADGWISARNKGYELRLGENKYTGASASEIAGPFKYRGSGIYEVMCQAKASVYNYKAAKIGPEFMKDPNYYVPVLTDYQTTPGYPEFDTAGGILVNNYGNVDNQSNLSPYMAVFAAAPDAAHGDIQKYPPNAVSEQKWIVAKRRVFIGEKTPDVGAWANLSLLVRSPHSTAGTAFVSGPFNNNPDDDYDDLKFFQVDEDEVVEFQAVAAVKYTLDLNEWAMQANGKSVWDIISYARTDGSAPDYTTPPATRDTEVDGHMDIAENLRSGPKIKYDDAVAKVHDLFSGVVPGTVTFEWQYFNEDQTRTISTTSRSSSLWDLLQSQSQNPPPPPAKEIVDPVEILVRQTWTGADTKINQSHCTQLADPGDGSLAFEFDVETESGNLVTIQNQQKRLANVLGGATGDLSWTGTAGQATGWQKFVPDGSAVALFYFDKRIDASVPGLVPAQPTGQDPVVSSPADYYSLRHFWIYNTPSIGKPVRSRGAALIPFQGSGGGGTSYGNRLHSYRVRVTMRGTVREYLPESPAVLQKVIDDINVDPLANPPQGSQQLTELAQAFDFADHVDQLLVERFINVVVHDRTAPVVTMDIPNKDTGATTGDWFSNPITVTVIDNNPYMSPSLTGGATDDFGVLWNTTNTYEDLESGNLTNKKGTGRFDLRMAYHMAASGNVSEEPAVDGDYKWADIPMVEPPASGGTPATTDSWCDIRGFLAGADPACRPVLVNPASALDSYSKVIYQFPANRWQMNADGFGPGRTEGEIRVYVSGVDGCGNGSMVMLNPGQADLPEPAIPHPSANTKTYRGTNQDGDGNLTADCGPTQSIGVEALPCRDDMAGKSLASENIHLRDNDPPEFSLELEYFSKSEGSFCHSMADGPNPAPDDQSKPWIGDENRLPPWRMTTAPEFITQPLRAAYPKGLVDVTDPEGKILKADLGNNGTGDLYLDFRYNEDNKIRNFVRDGYYRPDLIADGDPSGDDPDCDNLPSAEDPDNDAWEINSITSSGEPYFIETLLPDVGPDTAPPSSTRSFLPIPEDTRCKFRFRAQDNVDWVYRLDDFTGGTIFRSKTRFASDYSGNPLEGLVVFGPDKTLPDANPELASNTGEPGIREFGFHYHHREPTPGSVPNTQWIISLQDRAGNKRVLVLPIRIIDTRVNVISIEGRR
ncbi:MAG: hypothetical protein CVV64_02025 [Candidatus Wallbacteria bacterium HGW-Wallbacteria-1]|jgi:hypothetical protein|uniref:Uncharacterized protein n=1 Tax=Candidatus Wallbacteria bacterium HGW-Wallbacteria-1 TaxID=2013854 RepID=A0A2N1PV82_9BACT|nr:MAG: hypothetical protein CVV64_02025 [Candidatus Wallbacteria bacterium HGW-Wallbacteria-1]